MQSYCFVRDVSKPYKQRRTEADFHVNSQGNLHRSSALTSVSLIVPLANMGL